MKFNDRKVNETDAEGIAPPSKNPTRDFGFVVYREFLDAYRADYEAGIIEEAEKRAAERIQKSIPEEDLL